MRREVLALERRAVLVRRPQPPREHGEQDQRDRDGGFHRDVLTR
jgi:hypothetical protein